MINFQEEYNKALTVLAETLMSKDAVESQLSQIKTKELELRLRIANLHGGAEERARKEKEELEKQAKADPEVIKVVESSVKKS